MSVLFPIRSFLTEQIEPRPQRQDKNCSILFSVERATRKKYTHTLYNICTHTYSIYWGAGTKSSP